VTGSTKPSKPLRPFILGVAGGSGSGKTYFASALFKSLGPELCEIVYQDNFYIDQSNHFDFDGGSVNFDHPDSIDFESLADALVLFKKGERADIPIYDFVTHKRNPVRLPVQPKPVIIVDGILIFHARRVREQFHDLIFFDTPEDLRFQRRLDRDVKHRGRTPEGVHNQFYKQVKPMHDEFVEPSKSFAKRIVTETAGFDQMLSDYCKMLRNKIEIAPYNR
jgi:uridine kinase